jgi:hypothetical protein
VERRRHSTGMLLRELENRVWTERTENSVHVLYRVPHERGGGGIRKDVRMSTVWDDSDRHAFDGENMRRVRSVDCP